MHVSVIIVSWNVQSLLSLCLQSLDHARGDVDMEVFVVDNASIDGTREWLKEYDRMVSEDHNHFLHGRVHIVLNDDNKGFAAANNQALKLAMGEYILLLNPDTECTEESFPIMCQFMRDHSRCGIMGPRLLGGGAEVQQSVRAFPHWGSLTGLSLGWNTSSVRAYRMDTFDYNNAAIVDQVMGACFLIRRTMMESIGVLDEHFFIWFEEVDYCKRAKDAGWDTWYAPVTSIIHHGGESFVQMKTPWKQKMFSKSALTYFKKHQQVFDYWMFALFVPFRLFISLFLT